MLKTVVVFQNFICWLGLLLDACLQFIGVPQLTGSLIRSIVSSADVFPSIISPFFVDSGGHEEKLLISHQISRAEDEFLNPSFLTQCGPERGSDPVDE